MDLVHRRHSANLFHVGGMKVIPVTFVLPHRRGVELCCQFELFSLTVAAICHKSWGSRPEATSLPPPILLSSFPLVDSAWVWAEPAHPLPNI